MRSLIWGVIAWVTIVVAVQGQAEGSIVVYTTDFIANANRSHFNGFEALPAIGYDGGIPHTEDTIQVEQINDDVGMDIWTTYYFSGSLGTRAWYASGGDFGYTQISLAGGIDFQNVGFNYNSGGNDVNPILYELLDDGVVVLSGSAVFVRTSVNYLGFSGGGFDTIRVRDQVGGGGGTVTDGGFQALAIDNIETQDVIPEPSTYVVFAGLITCFGLAGWWRKRRQAA